MLNVLLLGIIVILICVLVYIYNKCNKYTKDFITGLWVANKDFCQRSGINGMLLYIGDESAVRPAYMIVYTDNVVVMSQKMDLTINLDIIKNVGTLEIDPLDDDNKTNISDMMPLKQHITIDFVKGKMLWQQKKDDELITYAELYKDNISVNNM
jgi:hypothetical protein